MFGERAAADPAAVFTAARAFARYPMLMLSVERMGVADPRVYAALARAARRIDRVTDPLERPRALSLFQGALALAESARLAGTLSPEAAGPALLALAEARPVRAGSFGGGVAAWLAERLLPELGVPVVPSLDSTAMDDGLLAALAGARPGGTGPRIEWEGLQYRFDRGAATLERLRRARAQLRGNHLDTVLAVARVADELARGAGEASSLTGAADTLEASTAVVRNPHIGLPGENARISSYANEVESIVRDLREMADRGRPAGCPEPRGTCAMSPTCSWPTCFGPWPTSCTLRMPTMRICSAATSPHATNSACTSRTRRFVPARRGSPPGEGPRRRTRSTARSRPRWTRTTSFAPDGAPTALCSRSTLRSRR